MAEPNSANKDALSRALGAVYLSHKVQQLEKTVNGSRGDRDRGTSPTKELNRSGANGRGPTRRGGPVNSARARTQRASGDLHIESEKSDADEKHKVERNVKDADVVVVDASVLVHALGQLKAWCRKDRKEIVVVPLEALNTLDMLKKGSSSLAQRARAASRILEQQVGTNDRIRVQRDAAFVAWDDIEFKADPANSVDSKGSSQTPEWLRRTICCAKWELVQASKDGSTEEGATTGKHIKDDSDSSNDVPQSEGNQIHKTTVVIAVCTTTLEPQDAAQAITPSPVPLPSPAPQQARCAGSLVQLWAERANIPTLDVKPTAPPNSNHSHANASGTQTTGHRKPSGGQQRHNRGSSDEDWHGGGMNGANKGSKNGNIGSPGGGRRGSVSILKPRDFASEKHASSYGSNRNRHGGSGGGAGNAGTLVERPAATIAMNASMRQPSKVIRVLARGEKLDP